MTNDLVLYLGVDHREQDALRVAEYSARMHASRALPIRQLDHLDLRRRNWFTRPWRIDETGQMWDERDGRPFSVQFSHSRFLTPLLAKQEGFEGWALFVDSDWLFLDDLYKILEEADSSKTVLVVPHEYAPTSTIKMDGVSQSRYQRKLWSALMLWNLNSKKLPTFEMVNEAEGSYLHRFDWLDDSDIGFVSESFHWIADASPTTAAGKYAEQVHKPLPINAVHFTSGIPTMAHRQATPFDTLWHSYHKSAQQEFADNLPNG